MRISLQHKNAYQGVKVNILETYTHPVIQKQSFSYVIVDQGNFLGTFIQNNVINDNKPQFLSLGGFKCFVIGNTLPTKWT